MNMIYRNAEDCLEEAKKISRKHKNLAFYIMTKYTTHSGKIAIITSDETYKKELVKERWSIAYRVRNGECICDPEGGI